MARRASVSAGRLAPLGGSDGPLQTSQRSGLLDQLTLFAHGIAPIVTRIACILPGVVAASIPARALGFMLSLHTRDR